MKDLRERNQKEIDMWLERCRELDIDYFRKRVMDIYQDMVY